jgi:hypothetical protein
MGAVYVMWRDLDPIRASSNLVHVPNEPGLYKLTFTLWRKTYVYFGEAGERGLRARINEYANKPMPGLKGEYLIHELLKEAGEAAVSTCCDDRLKNRGERLYCEKALIADTKVQRLMCLNRGGFPIDVRMRCFKLQSEERMLIRDLDFVRKKLAKIEADALPPLKLEQAT